MTNNLNSSPLNIEKFGLNLYKLREAKGFTRMRLAEDIGLTDDRIIYYYESGQKHPTIERALQIAMVLGVTLDSMFR